MAPDRVTRLSGPLLGLLWGPIQHADLGRRVRPFGACPAGRTGALAHHLATLTALQSSHTPPAGVRRQDRARFSFLLHHSHSHIKEQ